MCRIVKKVNVLLAFWFVFWCGSVADHPFHVSRMELEYKPAASAIQMSVHLFIDDLEDGLRKRGHDKLFVGTPKENTLAVSIMEAYLRQTIQIKVNGKAVAWKWVGKENTKDLTAVWCYLEVPNVKRMSELTVTNSTLTELFADQQNMVQVKLPNNKQGLLMLEKGHVTESIKL